jgi:protein-S-isoprenylcysteine O-methyltransferase Ste14
MKLKALVGAGDRVMGLALPFIVIGVVVNILRPAWFDMRSATGGIIAGIVLLAIGVPAWLTSVVQILYWVPRRTLITTGPFAVVLHPLYTSVALLVFPGVGLLLDTWLGFALGAILYASSRISSPREEAMLAKFFPEEYPKYRARVLLPWL